MDPPKKTFITPFTQIENKIKSHIPFPPSKMKFFSTSSLATCKFLFSKLVGKPILLAK